MAIKTRADQLSDREHQWLNLQPGERVLLTFGSLRRHGIVDEKTEDASCVWVHTFDGGRQLFHIEDGWHIESRSSSAVSNIPDDRGERADSGVRVFPPIQQSPK